MVFGPNLFHINTSTYYASSSTLHYIRIHTNIMAALLVFPYYLKYDALQQSYRLHRNKYLTGFCCITSSCLLLNVVEQVKGLIRMISTSSRSDPFAYFLIAEDISEFIYFVSALTTIWLKSDLLADIVAFLQSPKYSNDKLQPRTISYPKKKWLGIIYVITAAPVAVFILVLVDLAAYSWRPTELFKKYYVDTLNLLNLNSDAYLNPSLIVYALVVTFRIVSRFSGMLISASCDWLVITYSLLLYNNVEEYTQLVRNPRSSTAQIRRRYESLKMFSNKFNNWLGLLSFMLTLGCFPFLVSKFYEFVQPTNIGRFLHSFFNLGIVLIMLLLGAVIDKKARVTREWLSNPNHHLSMTPHELQVLLSEVQDCEIGIYGLGLFKFTTGMLGSVISLLVTFAVIMLQFKGT